MSPHLACEKHRTERIFAETRTPLRKIWFHDVRLCFVNVPAPNWSGRIHCLITLFCSAQENIVVRIISRRYEK